MFTQVKTPQDVFFTPQRLLVPLFQRPYVWSVDLQWMPLWDDVRRVAERLETTGNSAPHFLGAVVLQQQPNETGTLSVRTVIDGQQRLTTLQILLDAVHAEVHTRGFESIARQVLDLVQNPEHFVKSHEDKFKVWPTNRDRTAFNEVMSAGVPVAYNKLVHHDSRLVHAHRYFSTQIAEWLDDGNVEVRANNLVSTVSRYLQLVVIDLQADEDAQEIFETLNARGTPLTAADLIKNFVFQRLEVSASESEDAYHQYWEAFETPFWEATVSAGRVKNTRSSLFLSQWLVAQTREDITAREVFSRFKSFVTDSQTDVKKLLPQLRTSADMYRKFTEAARASTGPLNRLELFVYRTSTLDSEIVKPLLVWLQDDNFEPVPEAQFDKALSCIESWLIRRAVVRATSKNYNKLMVDLLNEMHSGERAHAGDIVEAYLARQTNISSYWPSDDEVRGELTTQPIYKRISRARLRMIFEAIEDKRRGFDLTRGGRLSESSVARGVTTLEHIMPQEWATHWPGDEVDSTGMSRDVLVHTLGNLTLVTQALNSKVSNLAWSRKVEGFKDHSTLLITAEIYNHREDWESNDIHARSARLANEVLQLWPVPSENQGLLDSSTRTSSTRITVADLVHAGFLTPNQTIYPRVQSHLDKEALISEDGGIFVDGMRYDTPSGAAMKITKWQAADGWWFWLVDRASGLSLGDVRREYMDSLSVEEDPDEVGDE